MNVSQYVRMLFVITLLKSHLITTHHTTLTRSQELFNTRQHVIKNCTNRALDPIIFNYLFAHDAEFAKSFANQLNNIIQIFYQLVDNDIFLRAHACLTFTQLYLDDPYNEILQKTIGELIPHYFAPDGSIHSLTPSDCSARNFALAQFLKNGIEYTTYKKLLALFNFTEVLAYEENTTQYLTDNLYHIASCGWLPSLSWYPTNIKTLIKEHPHNKLLAELLAYCIDSDLDAAHDFIDSHTHPLFTTLYRELCAQQKNELQRAWGITDEAPVYVHNALFELIHSKDTGDQFIQHIFALLQNQTEKELATLHTAFFFDNGILKQFEHIPRAQEYRFPQHIFNDDELLLEINCLFYEQHVYGTQMNGMIARIALDQLQAIYDAEIEIQTDCIDFDLEAALHPNFFSRLKMKAHSALDALQNLII